MFKSTIDWCEDNYAISNYIAEYYNTYSGIFIALSAFAFKIRYNFILDDYNFIIYSSYFQKIYQLLLLTSIGTMLFHGTLLFPFQMLDELPMLYISIEYSKFLLNYYKNNAKHFSFDEKIIGNFRLKDILVPFYFFEKMIYLIPLFYGLHNSLQILHFHITLKYFEILVFILLYKTSQNFNRIAFLKISESQNKVNNIELFKYKIKKYTDLRKMRKLNVNAGLVLYISSMLMWATENVFCENVRHLQLHMIWHILSSMGIYCLNNIMMSNILLDKICDYKVDEIESDKID